MLDYVMIDGQRASIGEHAHLFPNYFGIDSMSLLLGKNGSGKTRLLQMLAEVLTLGAPLGDQGHWVRHDHNGQDIRDTRYPPSGLGVVYFSPLPYQRPMNNHRNLINASRIRSDSLKESMLINFMNVATSLGISTDLTASLSYHKNIYERLIIPTLLEMNGEVTNSSINSLLKEYSLLRSGEDSNKEQMLKNYLCRSLGEWIESILENKGGTLYRVAVLATLDKLGKNINNRLKVTAAVLSMLGFANLESNYDVRKLDLFESSREFKSLLESSMQIIREENSLPINNHLDIIEVKFSVNGERRFNDLINRESAFNLSWTNLSSGLLSLVDQFARIEVALARLARRHILSVLVLIDEGDSFLHLDWQRQYVEKLDQFLTSAKQRFGFNEVQVIIATHSPIISGDFPSILIQRLDAETEQNIKTFGSSLDALVLDTFGTPSIGTKAARHVRRLRELFLQEKLTSEDQYLVNEIGDERLRRAVLAEKEELNDN